MVHMLSKLNQVEICQQQKAKATETKVSVCCIRITDHYANGFSFCWFYWGKPFVFFSFITFTILNVTFFFYFYVIHCICQLFTVHANRILDQLDYIQMGFSGGGSSNIVCLGPRATWISNSLVIEMEKLEWYCYLFRYQCIQRQQCFLFTK